MSLRRRIAGLAAEFADFVRGVVGEKRASSETGVAFAEASWAKWGVKPYRADDLLRSKALRLSAYREMMREPMVKAALYNRAFEVMAADWDLRAAGYDRRHPPDREDPAVQATDFTRSQIARPKGRWPKLLFDLVQALVDGFAVIEKNYALLEGGPWAGKVGLASLKAKDVDAWDFDCDEYMNVRGLRQQVQGVWYERERSKFIVFSWLPVFENPLGQSEFRAAYRAFWLKDNVHKFRAIYLETIAKGKQKVTYPADQGAAGLAKAQELLTLMENSIGLALPSDLQVELIEMAVAPDAAFEAALGRYDREIVTGLTGAALQMLEGAETGAYRATETHRKTAASWTTVFSVFVEGAIEEQLVRDLVEANFAGVEPPEVYFRWGREDLEPLSRTLKTLQEMGLEMPAWFLRERFQVPAPEDDDEVLEPRAVSPFNPQSAIRNPQLNGAAQMADPGPASDPREAAIDRAVARAPEAYRTLFETLKKKGRMTSGRPSMR